MSKNNYDIIVIGAGCGGLSAAVCSAKNGKSVLLLERHNSPGGFATSFVRGRFEFEASMSQLCGYGYDTGLGEARRVFEELGIDSKIKWLPIPYAYRFITHTRTGEKIDATMPFGVEDFIDAMEGYVPGSKPSMVKLFELAKQVKDATDHISETENELSFSEIRHIFKQYGDFARTAPYSVNEVLDALNVPQKARDIFEAYWMHFGIDCDRLSFTHYILSIYNLLTLGGVMPSSRSYAMSMALAGELEDNGGEIRYNSHVSRIKFKDGHACGVILKDGEVINANHIICNCSPTTAYAKMMKAKDLPESAIKRTNARSFGARGACVYLGLNRSPKELGIKDYSVIITDVSDSSEQFEAMKKIEANNALIATCLNIADPDCSASGTTILQLTTFYTDNCWADVPPEEYHNEKDMLAARLISAYEKATETVIHNSIEEIEVATPVTFARYTNSPQGVTHGYFGSDWDSLLPRVMTEKTDNDTKGLRFCGGWGTQLSGVDAAIVTGRNTAFATLCDINEEGVTENE